MIMMPMRFIRKFWYWFCVRKGNVHSNPNETAHGNAGWIAFIPAMNF